MFRRANTRIQSLAACRRLFGPLGCRKPLACRPVPCACILPYTTKEWPLLAAVFLMSKHPIPPLPAPVEDPPASIQIGNPHASPTVDSRTSPPPPPIPDHDRNSRRTT